MNETLWKARLVASAVTIGLAACAGADLDGSAPAEGMTEATQAVATTASLELYGTFNSMGVNVLLGSSDDPDADATAKVEYRISGSGGAFRPGFDLTRLAAVSRLSGSLFWLTPGTSYEVRVTIKDPDGTALDNLVLTGTQATLAEPVATPTPTSQYYVRSDGTGTCLTADSPCALRTALSKAAAGSTIWLRGGTYNDGEVTLPTSGAPGAPLVIRNYAGETVTFDGIDPAPFTWTAQGGGVYRTTVRYPDPHLVLLGTSRMYAYHALTDLQNLKWGPGFFATGTTLYVRLPGDADPSTASVRASRFNRGFTVDKNYIHILNIGFRNYGRNVFSPPDTEPIVAKAIYVNDGSNNLFRGLTFVNNDMAIAIKRNSHRNVIEQNVFLDSKAGFNWDAVKDGSGLESAGVSIFSPTTGRGNVIRGNSFSNFFDALTICPWADTGTTNETDVYNNTFDNIGDDAIAADGTCNNVRVWGNRISNAHTGVSMAPIFNGPIYALRNVIWNIHKANHAAGFAGRPFKFNGDYPRSGRMFLFHNTSNAGLAGIAGFELGGPAGAWELVYARNNIWSGTADAIDNFNAGQPVDFDFDDIVSTSGGRFSKWGSISYATFADFRSGTGQERNGLNVTPGFRDVSHNDLRLAATSRLVDRGLVIPGINDGYTGAGPDIGYNENTPGQALLLQPLTINATNPAAVTATFQVANAGDSTLRLETVVAALRTSSGANIDFPATAPVVLQPNEVYTYSASKALASGTYTSWPAFFDGTNWIHMAGNTTFTVP